MTDIQRDIGRLETHVAAIDTRLARVESKLDGLSEVLSQARGGWRTLLLVSGAAGAIGAWATKIATALAAQPPSP
jgi:NADPH:quinone reductase-like Zn-dependent oxidoreductase